MLRDRLGVSERWACRVVGQHRSTQRHEPLLAADDEALRAALREFAERAAAVGVPARARRAVADGWEVNRKRVQRLWREEGLRVVPAARASAAGPATTPARAAARRAAERGVGVRLPGRPDRRRAAAAAGQRRRRVHPRGAGDARRALHHRRRGRRRAREARRRGAARPAGLRCDNGPELTSHALRDWCRQSGAATAFIEPGAPWQNPFVESFHSRVRDELLNQRAVRLPGRGPASSSRTGARTTTTAGRTPRSGRRTPAAFAAAWTEPTRRRHDREPGRAARADGTPPLGSPSGLAFTAAFRPRPPIPSPALHPLSSHSKWTEERGPARSDGETTH